MQQSKDKKVDPKEKDKEKKAEKPKEKDAKEQNDKSKEKAKDDKAKDDKTKDDKTKENPKEEKPKEEKGKDDKTKDDKTKENPIDKSKENKDNKDTKDTKENKDKDKEKDKEDKKEDKGNKDANKKKTNKKGKKDAKDNKEKDNKKNDKKGKNSKYNTKDKRGKNGKGKENEVVLYSHFGSKVLNWKLEEQDLDTTKFLKFPISIIGILFTGTWAPPAKSFLVDLTKLYKEVNETEKVFEIVQISNEKTEKDFKDSLTEDRPWLYLPFNENFIQQLIKQFKVEFIPSFIIVNRDMFILSNNGRKDMIDNPGKKAYDIWREAYRNRKKFLEMQKEDTGEIDEQDEK